MCKVYLKRWAVVAYTKIKSPIEAIFALYIYIFPVPEKYCEKFGVKMMKFLPEYRWRNTMKVKFTFKYILNFSQVDENNEIIINRSG